MINEKISVIVPCFNEEKTIARNIEIIYDYLKEHYTSFEIIISNDGSTDRTLEELEKIKEKIPFKLIDTKKNAGKGDAVKNGILASDPDSFAVMFLDADLAIPINELNKFYNALKTQKLDLVIASRFVPGLRVVEPVLWYRKIMEKVFRLLRAIILNDWQVKDSQCGFKVFKRSSAVRIFNLATISRFAFDSEVIFLAKKFNFSIKELPITLCNPRVSHIRIVADSINMFFALFKIRLNNLKGLYKTNPEEFWQSAIIAVDDFGANPRANKKIIKLIKNKKIDRVAIMIKREISKEEIKILKKSEVKLDLHLELFPNEKAKPTGGILKRGFRFYFKYLRGDFYSSKIKQLWSEQIKDFEEIFGQKPDGLNSHEHVHLFPYFFKITCHLAKKNKIKYIRLGKNGQPFVNKIIRHILQRLYKKNKKIFNKFPTLQTSRYMLSLDWIIKSKNPSRFLKPETEIVCHPGRKNEYLFLKNLEK